MKPELSPVPLELSIPELMKCFSTEEKALKLLESIRWKNGVVCPHCGNNDQARFWKRTANKETGVRVGMRQCAECKGQFRVTIGTIFEDSHIPLNLWLIAWYLMCGAKKGMSALQMKRHLGLGSYKSAWFLCHRIRHALKETGPAGLGGVVEADEAAFGPKLPAAKGSRLASKTYVVSLVERGGNMRSVVVDRLTAGNLQEAVREHVKPGSTLYTDKSRAYLQLKGEYRHKTVAHAKGQYSRIERGERISVDYVESSFSLLRRGVAGNFHHISKQHLGLYLAEFDFRWNHRKTTDSERTLSGLSRTEGKRLRMAPPKQIDPS